MNRARLLIANAASALVGLALVHCGGADESKPVSPSADAEPSEEAAPPVEADADADAYVPRCDGYCGTRPNMREWVPTVLVVDRRPQPNAMFAPAPGNDPGFTLPLFVVKNEKATPARKPDVYVDSPKLPGVGFGCIAYDFASVDPLDPKGPGLTSGDMGTVVIDGYTGGTYLGGPSADAGIASPTTCTRAELVPGSGLFAYACGDYQYPATSFLQKTDTVRTKVAGGADVSHWNIETSVSPYDDLNVKNDLWHVTPDMVDGSKDLTIDFDCGGVDCTKTPFIDIVIESSDGRDQDAAPSTPFDFPRAKEELGVVHCFDFLPLYKNTYTIAKSLLAQIPPTWTDLRITLATLNAATGQVDNGQPILLGAGFARFGITHEGS